MAINHDLCIGCGNCIAACTHGARLLVDDTSHFFGDLKRGGNIIAIAAPAVVSVFPGKYLNLNGYLKSLGLAAAFDVSFGAELTVVSYIDYIKPPPPYGESAHAGEAGRGFAVVADEIRRLSKTTRQNSKNISQTLSSIIEGINLTTMRSGDTGSLINGMSAEINGFAGTMSELINTFSELSTNSNEITTELASLRELSSGVKGSYAEMLSMTGNLREAMEALAKVSAVAGMEVPVSQ